MLAAFTVVLNLGLNLYLIPRYKAPGAAIASISSQGFYAFGQIILSAMMFRLKPNYSLILRFCIFVAVMLWRLAVHAFILIWYIGLSGMCILAVILTWLLRIVTPKSIYNILRYDN